MLKLNNETKLTVSVILDIIGWMSYSVPLLGELSDFIFAPIEWIWIKLAYGSTFKGFLGFSEELLPFTDFIPMCTIAHFLSTKKQ